MADNAFVKILTALLKHQVKKVVGDETLGVIGQEIAALGGDKVDDQIQTWLGEKTNAEQLEKAAQSAQACFREKVTENEIQQWMVSLPLGNLPKVVEAIDELPSSPDESKLENALRESVALNWRKLSSEQVDHAVGSFLSCLRSALLPIEKQTLMIIGRSVLRTEDKVDLLIRWFEQYIITGKPVEIKQLNPELDEGWNLAHPYPMPPNFTGRVKERKMLTDWLNKDNENRLFILRALGGFGKSALTWHWLTHDVDSKEWTKVVFWSFYEGDASFEHIIEETLNYLKLEVPQGGRPKVDRVLDAMQSQKVLLIMDGFERVLRLYASMNAPYQSDEEQQIEENELDCKDINAEWFLKGICARPNIKSKVLMTTRLTPRAVKPRGEFMLGCREVELTALQPADAVEFFRKQKVKGTHTEIEVACAPYGYHPLSLRILARKVLRDFDSSADILIAQKYKIDGDLKAQRHHIFEVSYHSLPKQEQELLSTIACFRSPVEFKTLKAIAENKDVLDNDLHDLVDSGLLSFDEKNKKFDLHPIVRHYSYKRLTESDRIAVHGRLINYFAAVGVPDKPQTIEDASPIIELYFHTAKTEKFEEAARIYYTHLTDSIYFQFNAYQLGVELLSILFPDGEDKPPRIDRTDIQAWALNELGRMYARVGKPHESIVLREAHNELRGNTRLSHFNEKANLENKVKLSFGMSNLGSEELSVGSLQSAEKHLRLSFDLTNEMNVSYFSQSKLGHLLSYCGRWAEAEQELTTATQGFESIGHIQMQAVTWSYISFYFLLKCLESQDIEDLKNAINSAFHAKELANKDDPPVPYDHMYIHWLLGTTIHAGGNLVEAEKNLDEALRICRSINAIDRESNILLDIARLRFHQKKTDEAKSLADEALLITERCGYVLQGADVNLFLAELALTLDPSPEGRGKAKGYAEEAKKLATCDGPPYYYKVAYEEAERFLENL